MPMSVGVSKWVPMSQLSLSRRVNYNGHDNNNDNVGFIAQVDTDFEHIRLSKQGDYHR